VEVQWYGQSAFRLTAGDTTVAIDPFGDVGLFSRRGLRFEYPPIEGVTADLVLVTHEHRDHNGVEAIGGDPVVLRSTAGRIESPVGEVVAVASEHDAAAGTERGHNTAFRFDLDGVRVAHMGDFGQRSLRDEQAEAIGPVDLLFVPVGGEVTLDAEQAHAVAERLAARWIVPMHYRTPHVSFLQPVDAFLERMPHVKHVPGTSFETADLESEPTPLVIVPAVPA
jgi:L-ascorbate metabolism protein UlaG (beta-lactamase superfamily)